MFCILFGLLFWVSIITIHTKKQQKHLHRRKSYNLVNVWSWVSIHWLPEQSCPVFNKLTRHEPAIQSKNQHLVSGQLQKTLDLDELSTWARDMVTWYWSADTLFWQVSVDHNMDVQYQRPRLHVSLSTKLVPRAFSMTWGWGGKRPWHRLVTCPSYTLKSWV